MYQFLIGNVRRLGMFDNSDNDCIMYQFLIGNVRQTSRDKLYQRTIMYQFLIGNVRRQRKLKNLIRLWEYRINSS